MQKTAGSQPVRLVEILTILIGLLTLAATRAEIFIPGFYDGIVDPVYATVTADAVSVLGEKPQDRTAKTTILSWVVSFHSFI
jgi:hypothetical protein